MPCKWCMRLCSSFALESILKWTNYGTTCLKEVKRRRKKKRVSEISTDIHKLDSRAGRTLNLL